MNDLFTQLCPNYQNGLNNRVNALIQNEGQELLDSLAY